MIRMIRFLYPSPTDKIILAMQIFSLLMIFIVALSMTWA